MALSGQSPETQAVLSQQPDYGDDVRKILRQKGCEPYTENGQEQYDPEDTPMWVCPDAVKKIQVPEHIPSGELANVILGEADIDEHFPEGGTDVGLPDRQPDQPTAP